MEVVEVSSYWTAEEEGDSTLKNDPEVKDHDHQGTDPLLPKEKEGGESEEAIKEEGVGGAGSEDEGLTPNSNSSQSLFSSSGSGSGSGGSRSRIIQPIHRSVVNQICSGQVITTLSMAVKELLENSLDAGSTVISLHLTSHGSTLLEITDNGTGISPTNFSALCTKSTTSKLTTFSSLQTTTTFGFRGEALSSLAALCTAPLTLTTRHADSDSAHRLEYEPDGSLRSATVTARGVGTTVSVRGLFSPLPVRHSEFLRNLKREFGRMVQVVWGYALVSKGVRVSLGHQVQAGKGPLASVLSVPPSECLRERIAAVFGAGQVSTLIPVAQEEVLDEEMLAEFGLNPRTFQGDRFQLEGFISRPSNPRSAPDRQFFYVNGRPVDNPKLSRLVNTVYAGFSSSSSSQSSPFFLINVTTPGEEVDVNVTPDKRTLYLQAESSLFAILKASLVSLFTAESSSYPNPTKGGSGQGSGSGSGSGGWSQSQLPFSGRGAGSFHPQVSTTSASKNKKKDRPLTLKERFSKDPQARLGRSGGSPSSVGSSNSTPTTNLNRANRRSPRKRRREGGGLFLDEEVEEVTPPTTNQSEEQLPPEEEEEGEAIIKYDDELSDYDENHTHPTQHHLTLDWDNLKNKIMAKTAAPSEKEKETHPYALRFHAKIDSSTAEQELQGQLNKDSFSQMSIIGQFNAGFILVSLGPDLFLIDQHASDEKYNFETLQKTTVLQTQRLLCPLELDLPTTSESVILDHIETFKRNGFGFLINLEALPTKRIKLGQLPFSKTTEFGKNDIEELVWMLEDEPVVPSSSSSQGRPLCRPSKIRTMLASRACRRSVMIGTALGVADMRRIVGRMGDMDQPWNCPHGRPTIRHLFNTRLLPDSVWRGGGLRGRADTPTLNS